MAYDMTEPLAFLLPRDDGPAYPYTALQIHGILLVVIITFIAVAICGLRVYSRSITKTFGLPDWLVCAATVRIQTKALTARCRVEMSRS